MNATLAGAPPVPTIVWMAIDEIQIGPDRRPVDPAKVEQIAASIDDVGLMHYPMVRSGSKLLVVGRHRLEAFRARGKTHIPVQLVEMDELRAALAEIDENLHRHELNKLDRADQIWRRKKIYDELFPESRAGAAQAAAANRAQGREAPEPVPTFAKDAATRLGISERSIRHDLQIAGLSLAAKEIIRGTKLENSKATLLELSRREPEKQHELVRIILEGRAKDVYQAYDELSIEQQMLPELRQQLLESGLKIERYQWRELARLDRELQTPAVELVIRGSSYQDAIDQVQRDTLLQLVDETRSKEKALNRARELGIPDWKWDRLKNDFLVVKEGKEWRRATAEDTARLQKEDKSRQQKEEKARKDEERAKLAKCREAVAKVATEPFAWRNVWEALFVGAPTCERSWDACKPVAEHFGLKVDQVREELDHLKSIRVLVESYDYDPKTRSHRLIIKTQPALLDGLRPDQSLHQQAAACQAIRIRIDEEAGQRARPPVADLYRQGNEPETIRTLTGLSLQVIQQLLVEAQLVDAEDQEELAHGIDQVDQELRAAGELLERELTPDDVPGQLALPGCSPLVEELVSTWCCSATNRIATELEEMGFVLGALRQLKIEALLEECLAFVPLEFLVARLNELPASELATVLARTRRSLDVGRPEWMSETMTPSQESMWWNALTDEVRQAIKAYFVAVGRVWGLVKMQECREWWEGNLAKVEGSLSKVEQPAAVTTPPVEIGVEVEPYRMNRSTWRVTREIQVKALASCSMCSKPGIIYHPGSGRRCCEAHVPHGTEEVTRYVLPETPESRPAKRGRKA